MRFRRRGNTHVTLKAGKGQLRLSGRLRLFPGLEEGAGHGLPAADDRRA